MSTGKKMTFMHSARSHANSPGPNVYTLKSQVENKHAHRPNRCFFGKPNDGKSQMIEKHLKVFEVKDNPCANSY